MEKDILEFFPLITRGIDIYQDVEYEKEFAYLGDIEEKEDQMGNTMKVRVFNSYFGRHFLEYYDYDNLLKDAAYSYLLNFINRFLNERIKLLKSGKLSEFKQIAYNDINVPLYPLAGMLFNYDYDDANQDYPFGVLDTPTDLLGVVDEPKLTGSNENFFPKDNITDFVNSFYYGCRGNFTRKETKYGEKLYEEFNYQCKFELESIKKPGFLSNLKATYVVKPSDLLLKLTDIINSIKIKGLEFEFKPIGIKDEYGPGSSGMLNSILSNSYYECNPSYKFGELIERENYNCVQTTIYDKKTLKTINDGRKIEPQDIYYRVKYITCGTFKVKKCKILDDILSKL